MSSNATGLLALCEIFFFFFFFLMVGQWCGKLDESNISYKTQVKMLL